MSEELLKKFYTKILSLLQNAGEGVTERQAAATLKVFRDHNDKEAISQALVKLGLQDVHAFIETLQGHDIRSLDANLIVPQQIFISYLERILPILEKLMVRPEQYSLSATLAGQMILSQIQLLQKMLHGAGNDDVFSIMHSLIAAYPKQIPDLKRATVATLKQVGKPVVLALVDALYHGDDDHSDIPDLLKEMGYLAVPALIIALSYPEEKVRYASAQVLKKMKAREALPALAESLKDPVWRVRKAAAEAMGEIISPRGIPALIEALNDRHASVRLEVVKTLGKLQDPKVLKPLLSVLEDASWEVRRSAVEAMAKYGPKASTFLAKTLLNDSLVVRKIASRVLADIGTVEATSALTKATHDKDISVRERAIVALGRIKKEGSLVNLMYALEDKAPLVRFASVQTLINIGTRSTLPMLNKALKDPEQIIRQQAQQAVETILEREKKGEL